MGDINKMEEECTHNCMTCGHGCAEGSDGVGKFEKALNKLSDIDAGRVISNWLCFCSSSLPGTALIGKSPISSFVQSAVSPVATLADTVGPRSRPIAVAPTNIISGLYSLMTAARACAYGSVRYVSSSGLSTTITLSAPYSPNSSVKPFTFDPRRTAVTSVPKSFASSFAFPINSKAIELSSLSTCCA